MQEPENPFAGIQEAASHAADNERTGITEYHIGKAPDGSPRLFVMTGCHPSNFEQVQK